MNYQKPESMTVSEYVKKLEETINILQTKNSILEETNKLQDFIVRNDFLSAKEKCLDIMKLCQEMDEK